MHTASDDVESALQPLSTSRIRRALHGAHHSIANRIRSLLADAAYVDSVLSLYGGLPAFSNLRAGEWHIDPRSTAGAAYFKSTDGHAGCWALPFSRLNISFAVAAATAGGALLVDSTRRGKRFPDALSKTVPLWTAVVNAIVLGLSTDDAHLPPWVPPSEAAQIRTAARMAVSSMPDSVANLIRMSLGSVLRLPLKCTWVCQPTNVAVDDINTWDVDVPPLIDCDDLRASVPIVCISASRCVGDVGDLLSAQDGWNYVQGAGDDAENWAPDGFTPWSFFKAREAFNACRDDSAINAIVEQCVRPIAGVASRTMCPCACMLLRDAASSAYVRWLDDVSGESRSPCAVGVTSTTLQSVSLSHTAQRSRGQLSPNDACVLDGAASPAHCCTRFLHVIAAPPRGWLLIIRLSPMVDAHNAAARTAHVDSGETASCGRSHVEPNEGYCITLEVPVGKQAHRHADGGKWWQTHVFTTVSRAVHVALSRHAEEAVIQSQGGNSHRQLDAPTRHTTPGDSIVITYDTGADQAAPLVAAFVKLLLRARVGVPDSSVLDKATIRSVLAQALACAGVPSVARELQQQLNYWFIGRPRLA